MSITLSSSYFREIIDEKQGIQEEIENLRYLLVEKQDTFNHLLEHSVSLEKENERLKIRSHYDLRMFEVLDEILGATIEWMEKGGADGAYGKLKLTEGKMEQIRKERDKELGDVKTA